MDENKDPNDYKTYISDSHSSQSSDQSDSGSDSWESESSSNFLNDMNENVLEQFLARQNRSRYTEDKDWRARGDDGNYDDENPLASYCPTDLSKVQVNLVNGRLEVNKKKESKTTSRNNKGSLLNDKRKLSKKNPVYHENTGREEGSLTEPRSALGCVLLHISAGKIVLIIILSAFITYLLHNGILNHFNFGSYFSFTGSEKTVTSETCDTCEKISPQLLTSAGDAPSLKPELTIQLS